jgi:hypothetical protein
MGFSADYQLKCLKCAAVNKFDRANLPVALMVSRGPKEGRSHHDAFYWFRLDCATSERRNFGVPLEVVTKLLTKQCGHYASKKPSAN